QAWQRCFELQSERERDRFSGAGRYERRRGRRRIYRNGYYERDFVTRFGTIRLRIARTREKSFLPVGLRRFQRRAEEVSWLIREAFLRGISTRQVGPGGGHHHGRDSKRADGVEADAGFGRGGAPVSSGAVERRLCLSVSGRGELAGAATGRDASRSRCWWRTGSGAMAAVTCWLFCAVRAKV